ncbi:esterase/lipase family protein [Amycolatopsis cihanbeyliensis]|uniref:Lipase (Class 2) n=1 Tax=Amycolatopsis cihanbeyliensis TaxID=1128664 RepID=A0A542DBX9_AMYCI|nr:lipase [Amycolatopsis cihanbeyliensis]TQJ00565.1 lipase (class 2) [Amycolatopsis cihanbeyliensis]
MARSIITGIRPKPAHLAAGALLASVLAVAGLITPAAAATAAAPSGQLSSKERPPEFTMPKPSMEGVNDWDCWPSRRHPRPVVLLHGFNGDPGNWSGPATALVRDGYCVFAPEYGKWFTTLRKVNGIAPIPHSAAEIDQFVGKVLTATGARQVDMAGHSEGATLAEYYVKNLARRGQVASATLFSPSTQGTTVSGLTNLLDATVVGRGVVNLALLALCPACGDALVGSRFISDLNEGGVTRPGVRYAVLSVKGDWVVTPPERAFINEPGVNNVWLTDLCPDAEAGHFDSHSNPVSVQVLLNQLDPAHAKPIDCTPQLTAHADAQQQTR